MSVEVLAPPLQSYLRMAQIRAFETRILDLFGEKLIRGSAHPYTGQEAIAVGVCDALGEDDYITSTHRGHGHCIAKGARPEADDGRDLRAARRVLPRQGRLDAHRRLRHGMLGADAIVGGASPIAAGAASALQAAGQGPPWWPASSATAPRTRASSTRQ